MKFLTSHNAFTVIAFIVVFFTYGAKKTLDARPEVVSDHGAQAQHGAPEVGPDEACFYSSTFYTGLIGCVKSGDEMPIASATVNSVVMGKNVTVASTAACQFYGPESAYSTADTGCVTDRLRAEASPTPTGS